MKNREILKPVANAETGERIQFIQEQLAKGIDFDTCIGVHGTSLQSLIQGINTGFIPGSPPYDDEYFEPERRDLYFCPFQRHASIFPLEPQWLEEQEAFNEVKGYARTLAQTHAFLSTLGVPLEDPVQENTLHAKTLMRESLPSLDEVDEIIAMNYSTQLEEFLIKNLYETIEMYEELIQFFASLGYSEEQTLEAKQSALKYKGIMVGFHPSVLEQYTVLPGDLNQGDLRIRSENGLDLRHIVGCKLMGAAEKRIVKKW